jgi:DUF4097 and DUF4098 domain-containing protein YvlB
MKILNALAASTIAWSCWACSPVSVAGAGGDVTSVNKSVTAESGQSYGRLSTVNGHVRVERGASASEAKTVNGSIQVEADARLGTLSTVNGSLDVAEGVAIEREARTVNGGVKMRRRSRVGGDVGTVNGYIDLEGTEVGGRVITNNGDIDLHDGTRVSGGIHVRKTQNWGWKKPKPNVVTICATCVVEGELRFDQPVKLRVEKGARIGPVIGDEITRL